MDVERTGSTLLGLWISWILFTFTLHFKVLPALLSFTRAANTLPFLARSALGVSNSRARPPSITRMRSHSRTGKKMYQLRPQSRARSAGIPVSIRWAMMNLV